MIPGRSVHGALTRPWAERFWSMAEQSKFAGALAKLKRNTTAQDGALQPAGQGAAVKGRRPGKRSDPAYEPTTVILRKDTKRLAYRKLEDRGEQPDLSVLIERLLQEWIARA